MQHSYGLLSHVCVCTIDFNILYICVYMIDAIFKPINVSKMMYISICSVYTHHLCYPCHHWYEDSQVSIL